MPGFDGTGPSGRGPMAYKYSGFTGQVCMDTVPSIWCLMPAG